MKKNNQTGDALLALILLVPVTLLSAYTTMNLWNWFVSNTFNIIKLGMWQAYGIDLLVTYLTYKKTPKEEEKEYGTTLGLLEAAFITLVFLGVGVIIKQFI